MAAYLHHEESTTGHSEDSALEWASGLGSRLGPRKEAPINLSAVPSRYRLRVKQRLVVIDFALTHGVMPASERYGLDRKTVQW